MPILLHVRTQIDMTYIDGIVCEDDTYEVSGNCQLIQGGNGWAPAWEVCDLLISAPGGDVDTSRAIPDCLPSNWEDVAECALAEKAGEDRDNDDGMPDEDMHPCRIGR